MIEQSIIYIGGYGRSGSTILALLLSQEPEVTSVGELGALHRALRKNKRCTCGEALLECSFWAPLLLSDERKNFARLCRRDADVKISVRHALSVSGSKALVDSTKTSYRNALRPWKLHRAGYQILVVRLVRDVRSVIASSLKGRNSDLEAGKVRYRRFVVIRTLVSWLIANLAAILYKFVPGIKYVRVSYDDMVTDPISTLEIIERATDLDFAKGRALINDELPLQTGHEINGNRLLRSGEIKLMRR